MRRGDAGKGLADVRLIDFNVAVSGLDGLLSPVGARPYVAPEVRPGIQTMRGRTNPCQVWQDLEESLPNR